VNERGNNFDLLRLVFAGAVLLWHGYDLSKNPALAPLSQIFSPELAIKAFFVVSGYLVVMSCERSSSLASYTAKRLRRIYPAYITVVLLCALGGVLLTTETPGDYFSAQWVRYVLANAVFLNFLAPNLPGLFAANPWTEVNGALWTLKIEVMFYMAVPVIMLLCRRWGSIPVLAGLFVLSLCYSLALGALAEHSGRLFWAQLQRQMPGQLTYFLVGAALYLYRDQVQGRWPVLLLVAAVAYALTAFVDLPWVRALCEPLWLGISVVFCAVALPFVGNFARFGDLSYGIYIIHFPVIQVAVAWGFFAASPWLAFSGCVAVTLVLACASWHLVEKPFLNRRSHYRMAEAATAGAPVTSSGRA